MSAGLNDAFLSGVAFDDDALIKVLRWRAARSRVERGDSPGFTDGDFEVAAKALDMLRDHGTERVTHGRHCTCSACAREDWTQAGFAPCGMHGLSCPNEYRPLGAAGSLVPRAAHQGVSDDAPR